MKAKQTYLKGKSIFIVSLIVIAITSLTVYFTGENYHRSITSNFYISLGIIASALFIFITYGLYKGVELIDNFPKFKSFESGVYINKNDFTPDFPALEIGEGISGLIMSILFWVGMTIVFIIALALLEMVFWFSIFIILAMLYWLFFRALKLVFSKSPITQNNLGISIIYSLIYTALYIGWLFAIVYITQIIK